MPTLNPLFRTLSGRYFARRVRRLVLALGGALALLLLGSSHWQAAASLSALDDLKRQADRVEHLDSLLIQLMDAESAVRGYLLSGNRGHLDPYKTNRTAAKSTLELIRRDLGANSGNELALADLSGLVSIKLRSLDEAVERRYTGNESRATGMHYTDRIRDRILRLKEQLDSEGQNSFERSTKHIERTRWVVVTLAMATLILMMVLFLLVERQFKLREQSPCRWCPRRAPTSRLPVLGASQPCSGWTHAAVRNLGLCSLLSLISYFDQDKSPLTFLGFSFQI